MESLVIPSSTAIGVGAVAALRRARCRRLARAISSRVRSPAAVGLLRSLERRAREDEDGFLALLSDPCVGVLADTGNVEGAIATLALLLACDGALERPFEIAPTRLAAPAHGLAFEPDTSAVEATLRSRAVSLRARVGSELTLPLDASDGAECSLGRAWRAYPAITGPLRLGLFDPSPLSLVEAHPEKQGNWLSLGDHPVGAWLEALADAFGVIERTLPELRAEMDLLLRLVFPTGAHEEKQLSASYREYIGALYVTLHPQRLSLTEALIHEFQHNKLNLCAQHYELIENAYAPLYPSPIRPDPRPLMGVLLAAHAFVPVAELYRRLLGQQPDDAQLRRRLGEVISANDEALATLSQHARFTPVGARVHADLSDLHAAHVALGLPLSRRSHVA